MNAAYRKTFSVSQDVPPSFHRPQSRLGYEERPQSRVGYTSDSRCASGLGYDDTGGGYLDQSDPRMYCTSGYCMGDTMMAASRGVCGEEVELDMRRHIQACACTCNHMGYGNYMDYQVNYPFNRFVFINYMQLCSSEWIVFANVTVLRQRWLLLWDIVWKIKIRINIKTATSVTYKKYLHCKEFDQYLVWYKKSTFILDTRIMLLLLAH